MRAASGWKAKRRVALAPGHRLGQIVGNVLERALEPRLQAFADEHGLYLDKTGPRPARKGLKVTWTDGLGNKHDLDFVLERGGDAYNLGVPVAFIETAWRRYTKHSKNKAQEIQGAVLPLLGKYGNVRPFAGVVLAGVFTAGSLDQLRSNGFAVVYVPFEVIVDVFRQFGIDLNYNEATPDEYLSAQIEAYERLKPADLEELAKALRDTVPEQFNGFFTGLGSAVLRRIKRVTVLPLHGEEATFEDVQEAIAMVRQYKGPDAPLPLVRFELMITYTNGDRIAAEFADSADAVSFLETFLV
jgi:hypothetical protein